MQTSSSWTGTSESVCDFFTYHGSCLPPSPLLCVHNKFIYYERIDGWIVVTGGRWMDDTETHDTRDRTLSFV